MPTRDSDPKQMEHEQLEKLKRIALIGRTKTSMKAIDAIRAYGEPGVDALVDIAEKAKLESTKQYALESVRKLRES